MKGAGKERKLSWGENRHASGWKKKMVNDVDFWLSF
jgi:hypothetical protein